MDSSMSKSERILAAVQARKDDPTRTLRELGALFDVSHTSIANHINGKQQTASDYSVTQQRLTPAEEAVLIKFVQLAYQQAFPMTIASMRQLANEILQEREDHTPVGANWHLNFLKRHPELRTALSRPIDKQRVMAENPEIYIRFFRLFEDTRAKYGICDDDIYNMDESGCAIGVEQASRIIIPANEKETFAKQDGKREWATLIECIGAAGTQAPAFLILAGKSHLVDNWANARGPKTRLALSHNGWTNDDLGFEWLQHFDAWSRDKSVGAYRLLLLDGHSSHLTLKFLRYAVDHNILLLCLPPHATHRLQPLDVGIFGPMNQAYDTLVKRFNRYNGRGVTQREYIDWIQQAREKACSKTNIVSAFTAVGLIPFNPNRVLSKLRIKKQYHRPSTPPEPPQAPEESNESTTTPFYRVQQGSTSIDIPIGSFVGAEALIDRVSMATPLQANHVAALKSLVQWQRANIAVLNHQIQVFESVRANERPRTKRKIKGSAKVYSKEEVDALEAAQVEQERIKDVELAQRALRRLETANKKAQREQERQERASRAAQGQIANQGQQGSRRQGEAPAQAPVSNQPIRITRAIANYQLHIDVDALE